MQLAAGLLDDETTIERILRLANNGGKPAVLLSTSADGNGAVRWQEVDAGPHGTADGVVVDGATYHRWRLGNSGAGPDRGTERLVASLASEVAGAAPWRWCGPPPRAGMRRRGVGGEPVSAPLPPPTVAELPVSLGLSPERRSSAERRGAEALEKERAFRWGTPPLFLPRSGPRRPSSGTPRQWVPSPTVALDLVVRESGEAVLQAVRGDEAKGGGERNGDPRITLGRLWARGFPGTLALYDRIDVHSHAHAYRISERARGDGEARLGFAATEAMSGTVPLSGRLDWGVAALGARGIVVHRPEVVFEGDDVFLEPAGDDAPAPRRRRGRTAPYLSGAGGMGATLYDPLLDGGTVPLLRAPRRRRRPPRPGPCRRSSRRRARPG